MSSEILEALFVREEGCHEYDGRNLLFRYTVMSYTKRKIESEGARVFAIGAILRRACRNHKKRTA